MGAGKDITPGHHRRRGERLQRPVFTIAIDFDKM
jgi:hypothetical protein